VAQSVERRTLGSGSGRGLRVMRLSRVSGSMLSPESAWVFSLSLFQIKNLFKKISGAPGWLSRLRVCLWLRS